MDRKWKFRRNIVDKLSLEVKTLVRKLLEPEVTKRICVDEIVTSPWIAMDSRLKTLNIYEESALIQAKREVQIAVRKAKQSENNDGTVRESVSTEIIGSESISFLKRISEQNAVKQIVVDSRVSITRADPQSRTLINHS